MNRSAGLLTIAVLAWSACTTQLSAQTYYVGLRGGYVQPHDGDLEIFGVPAEDVSFAAAPMAAAAFGFASHDGWRLEGELSWLRSDVDTVGGIASAGEAEIWAAMANLYYGFGAGAAVTPYLGGGVGLARASLSDVVAAGGTVDGFDTALAWHAAAGVDVAVSDAVVLSLEYRYFVADSLRFDVAGGGRAGLDFRASSAVAGVRFGF